MGYTEPVPHDSGRTFRRDRPAGPSKGWQGPTSKWSGAPREASAAAASYVQEPARAQSVGGPGVGGVGRGAGWEPAPTPSSSSAHASSLRSHTAPAVQDTHEGRKGSLFGSKHVPPPPTSHSHSGSAEAHKTGGGGGWLPWGNKEPEHQPARGRYIPPSERKPGEGMFADAPRAKADEARYADQQQPGETWAAWAARQHKSAGEMVAGAGKSVSSSVQSGWDSVNDAGKRDQALSTVGNSAAKVAGGAIKYTAKGVWAVTKKAF